MACMGGSTGTRGGLIIRFWPCMERGRGKLDCGGMSAGGLYSLSKSDPVM